MFPITDSADWNVKSSGEIGLGHAEFAPDGMNGDHEIELRERRIRIFAIFDGVVMDFVFGCGGDLRAVDSRSVGPQLV
ncbi:MAG: hypothetical protein ACLPID_02635 [Beijerinckiaceae bacterium]